MKKVPVTIMVPVEDLIIEGEVNEHSVESEFWGHTSRHKEYEVEVECISIDGLDYELDDWTGDLYNYAREYLLENR